MLWVPVLIGIISFGHMISNDRNSKCFQQEVDLFFLFEKKIILSRVIFQQ